jgi:hypothetical protein
MSDEKSSQLKAEVENRIERLASLTSDAMKSEAMKAYLETVAKFHRYSFYNQLLIAFQKPEASRVAGYNGWRKVGRQVRRGEKGIAILAPIVIKKQDEGGERSVLVGFKTVYVFDVAQTDGADLPDAPDWKSLDKDEELTRKLFALAESKGIKVSFQDFDDDTQGVSKGGEIILANIAGTKTFVHEIAHELMHKVGDGIDRATKELEAEAVAFVVATHFGLDCQGSPNYLALWDADPDRITERMDRVRKCACEIITAIEGRAIAEQE